jgi:hypothetical protein
MKAAKQEAKTKQVDGNGKPVLKPMSVAHRMLGPEGSKTTPRSTAAGEMLPLRSHGAPTSSEPAVQMEGPVR